MLTIKNCFSLPGKKAFFSFFLYSVFQTMTIPKTMTIPNSYHL